MSDLKVFPVGKRYNNEKEKWMKYPLTNGVNWKDYQASEEELSNATNIGIVIPDGVVVFDLDTHKGVTCEDVESAIGCTLDWEEAEIQSTVSGGKHYAFTVDSEIMQGSDVLGVNGFDTRSSGKGWICSGDGYEPAGFYDSACEPLASPVGLLPVLPETAVGALTVKREAINSNKVSGDEIEDLFGSGYTSNEIERSEVIEKLKFLDPSMSNDQWVRVGMALHHWDQVEGLTLWDMWSSHGDNYDEGECAKRWRSFDSSGNGARITLGSVFKAANERKVVVEYDDRHASLDDYLTRVSRADEKELQTSVAVELRNESFEPIEREMLAKAFQDRIKKLTDVRISITEIRKLINPARVTGELVGDNETPNWCENWVYINSHAAFFNLDNKQIAKTESFNVLNGVSIPIGESGTKQSAAKFVSDNGFVEHVGSLAYLPMLDDAICTIDGCRVVNTFDHDSVPKAAKHVSDEGEVAIETVKKHIRFICGNDSDAEVLTQWIAHQVQYPGRKLIWAPMIQSIQGVGKSFFAELLKRVLGRQNVGIVLPEQVVSSFNGWATNVCVNVLEELKIAGHNRHEAANALKNPVSDPDIQINEKGVKTFTTANTANYICFTNHRDALPLEDSDRRWWVIFVDLERLTDIGEKVGQDHISYFDNLWTALRSDKGQLRKWLLDYPIDESFMNLPGAPMTMAKAAMIATEKSSHDGVTEIKEVIDKGGKYFNKDVISSSDLFEAAMFEIEDLPQSNRAKNTILKQLGYVQHPTPVKVDGKARRLWTRVPMSKEAIVKAFSIVTEQIPF